MNPMIYLHLCLTNRHLKLLLFVVACLLCNFSNTLAQTVLNCPSGGGIVAPIRDYVGDGHLPYRFHHKDGTYNNIFYRDETIYSYGVTSNGTCRAPNSSLFRTPIMPSAFTSLCTPANNPFFFSLNNVSDIIQKKCQMVFTTQYVYSHVEHFQATVTGDFNIAYNNSNGTTVNLTILDRYALYTDYGNLSGNYNETGTRNGKKKFVDSDGNELYYDATNAQWVVSGSTGIAYSVASTADAPPLTGWQIVANDCIGRNLKVVFGEYTPNFNITYTLDNTCKPEYNGVYKSTGILNNRPFLTGPNNHRIWFNETTDRQLWQIDNGGLYYVGSSITVPVNWRRDAECIVRESSINVVIGPERIVLNPITICVKTLCGNYEGIYTPKTLFNERPDLKDDDNNRLFYWGGGDPTHPEGWYIADANNKYVFYNSSNAESVPTTGWQAFTGDGITCTNNIGVFENECQPCPTYSVESIAYGSASYCKSTTEATVTITGSAGGVFTSTQGLSIDANSGTINPSTSTAGTYTITYSLGGTNGCVLTTATASVTIEELKTPSVSISANPSGSITAGTSVTFTATPTNGGTTPTYIWKKNNVTIPNETGATLTTTTLADGDKIKVEMTSSDVCASSAMATSNEITVAVCSLPTAYNVTGGGPYCAGSGGSVVGLSSSQTGVNYQLKKDNVNVGSVVAGTGSAISFGNQTQAGLYTVEATKTTGGCVATMSGNAVVSVVAQPVAYNVTGGGSFCQGGSGVVVGLSGSETGVSYQLKKGGVNVGSAVAGTGSAISFGNQSVAGTYTVETTKTGGAVPARIGVGVAAQPSTVTCTQAMTGSVEITVISLPTAYNVTGGIGSAVGLSSSQTGVNYQLKKDNMNVGSVVAGTGNAISFGNQTQAGLYTVEATTATGGCVSSMSGNAVVTINTLPSLFSVTGGGSFCPGGSGVLVGLSGSETGVSYQLKKGDVLIGNALSGTGSAISFGNQTDVGTYTVVATNTITSCTTSMTGSASVTNYALPTAVVSGTSLVCKGGSAVTVTFTGSNGVAPYTFSYQVNGGSVQTVTTTGGSASATVNQSTSTEGVYTYTLVSVRDANCSQTQSGSAVVTVQTKPTIVLNTLQRTLNEGNTQVFCDTDANPVNGLQFTVSGLCVVGNPVWRVQVGGGSWSEWSATAPVTQLSNNQPHRYQAACDVSCPVTYTSPIELTINYRASVPQNVSLLVDGVTVAAGETKEVCSLTNSPISFTANCGAGELLLYSVDGGEYSAGVPLGLVDNQFHNYRVRCRKSDGTSSCVESESGVMRLKLVRIPTAPTVSLSPTTSCNPASIFSGQSSCGSLRTVWYNATTNVALSSLPSTVPSETSSYYARCQTENGCVSEKSNVVTFTVIPIHVAPIVTVSQDVVCTGTTVRVSANCPAGSTTSWNTGVTTPSFEVAFSNVTKQSYWAKCVFEGGCQSAESNRKEVSWKAFVVSLINIGESKSATKMNDRAAWSSQFIMADGGPELDQSTQQSPTLYYVENVNKMAPRYWTIHADACALGTNGSLTFDMLATPEMGVIRSFNTHENNAPYFMYANREGWTELYGPNHPAYGFYEDNGSGGNVYDAGLPKGLYKLSIRYWDMKGWGSIYPSTRKPQGNVLAYQEYWFRIQSKDGVGVGAAREMANGQEANGKVQGSDNGKQLTDNGTFATVLPNPVTNILRLKVQDSKGQMVQTSLTDAAGREVLSRQFRPETNTHQEEFGVSELPTGMYFLKVTTPDKQATLKVLKIQ